jgi:hypothetical protein
MTESLKGISLLEEVSTVAIKVCSHMTEMYIAYQYLSIPIPILVIPQLVRMYQIDTFILLPLAGSVAFAGRLHCPNETQPEQAQQQESYCTESHLIQP